MSQILGLLGDIRMQSLEEEDSSESSSETILWNGREVALVGVCCIPLAPNLTFFVEHVQRLVSGYFFGVNLADSPFVRTFFDKIVSVGNRFIKLKVYTKDDIEAFLGCDYIAVFNNALYETILEIFDIQKGDLVSKKSFVAISERSLHKLIYDHCKEFKETCQLTTLLTEKGKKNIQWHLCCDEEKKVVSANLSTQLQDLNYSLGIVSAVSKIRIPVVEQTLINMAHNDNSLKQLTAAFKKLDVS